MPHPPKSEKENQSGTMSTLMEMWMAKDMGDPEAARKEALGEKPAEPQGGGGLAEMMKKMQGGGGQGGGVMMKMTTETTKISTGPHRPGRLRGTGDYKLVAGR